jgi:hypothetical protein
MSATVTLAPDLSASCRLEQDATDMLNADEARFNAASEPMNEEDLGAQIREHERFVSSWYEGFVGAWE